jgi:hypothetical protein
MLATNVQRDHVRYFCPIITRTGMWECTLVEQIRIKFKRSKKGN